METAIFTLIGIGGAIALLLIVGVFRLIPWWTLPIVFLVCSFVFGWIAEYEERNHKEPPLILQILMLVAFVVAISIFFLFFMFPSPIGVGGG